jgi:hypothetical protein
LQLSNVGQLAIINLRGQWASIGPSLPALSVYEFASMLESVGIVLTDDEAKVLLTAVTRRGGPAAGDVDMALLFTVLRGSMSEGRLRLVRDNA